MSSNKDYKINVLVAYPYLIKSGMRETLLRHKKHINLMIDSGAFTAFNSGKNIDIDEYCQYVKAFPMKNINVQMDVIGDHKKSYKNYLYIKKKYPSLNSLPVFTRGADPLEIDRLYSHNDYVLLGGIASGKGNKSYVKWFLEKIKNYPKRRTHLLGFVNIPFILKYRPTSADSSTWSSSSRFGNIQLYKGKGQIKVIGKSDLMNSPTPELLKLFRFNGIPIEWVKNLRFKESWRSYNTEKNKDSLKGLGHLISSISCLRRAYEVEKKVGTKIYFACVTLEEVNSLIEAKNYLIERNLI